MNSIAKSKLGEIRDLNVNSNSKPIKDAFGKAKVIKLPNNQDSSFKEHVRNISNHTKSF